MSSLFRRPNSPFWYMAYLNEQGHPVKESTKQTDRNAAKAVLAEAETAVDSAKRKVFTQVRAWEIISRMFERATGEVMNSYTIEGWLNEWLAACAPSSAPATYLRYKNIVRDFVAFLGKRKLIPLDGLAPKDIREFRDKAFEEGASAVSANMLTKVLSVPLNIALKQQLIKANPALALKPITGRKPKTRDIFTDEQVKALLEAAKPSVDWFGAILFGYNTGARLSDIANMTWAAVDLEKGVLSFTPQKTATRGTEIVMPIAPPLLSWLKAQPRAFQPTMPIFPSLVGKYTGGSGLSGQFAKIMDAAGIERKTLRKGDGRGYTTYNLSFHSFRITFVSKLKAAGVSTDTVMSMVGHTDEATNRHYTRVAPESQLKAIEALAVI
jgi:integrase